MEKRGFAITFKWIFALIAGLIIFLFLINFAYKHISLSESKTSTIILSNIETQLNSLSTSEDLDTSIDFPEKIQINFNCNSIIIDNINTKTENIIFSNNKLDSKSLQVWSKTWEYPFKITNFFYIADEKETFYLFNPPYDLTQKIPRRFNILSPPDEVPKNSNIIFFNQPSASELSKYKNHKIKIINNNKVTFYPGKTTDFLGDEMLIGTIFTDDFNKFECLKNKAISKLKLIVLVHQKRAQTLSQLKCTDKYVSFIAQLEQFKSNQNNPETIDNLDTNLEQNDCIPLFN